MSDPIDLDLVELRCRLRGWPTERHPNRLHAWGPAGWVWFDPWAYGGDAVEYGPLLTAPRWTLERLLSEPPEGWKAMDYGVTKTLLWGQPCVWGEDEWSDCEVIATLMVSKEFGCVAAKTSVAPSVGPENLARLAERHKAAAELALILAEVEP